MTQHRQRVPVGKGLHVFGAVCTCEREDGGGGETSGVVLSAQVAIKASRQETAPDPLVLLQMCLLHVIMSYANLGVMRLRPGQVLSDGPTICPSHPPRLGAFGGRLMLAVTFKAGSDHREDTQGLRNDRGPERGTESLERLRKTAVRRDLCSRGSAALSLWS